MKNLLAHSVKRMSDATLTEWKWKTCKKNYLKSSEMCHRTYGRTPIVVETATGLFDLRDLREGLQSCNSSTR